MRQIITFMRKLASGLTFSPCTTHTQNRRYYASDDSEEGQLRGERNSLIYLQRYVERSVKSICLLRLNYEKKLDDEEKHTDRLLSTFPTYFEKIYIRKSYLFVRNCISPLLQFSFDVSSTRSKQNMSHNFVLVRSVLSVKSLVDILESFSYFYSKGVYYDSDALKHLVETQKESNSKTFYLLIPTLQTPSFQALIAIFALYVETELEKLRLDYVAHVRILHAFAKLQVSSDQRIMHILLQRSLSPFFDATPTEDYRAYLKYIPFILSSMETVSLYHQKACTLFPHILSQSNTENKMTTAEIASCLTSFYKLRVFHEGIGSTLLHLARRSDAEKEQTSESRLQANTVDFTFSGIFLHWNALDFVLDVLEKYAGHKTLMPRRCFIEIMFRVLLGIETLQPKSLVKIYRLLSFRDEASLLHPRKSKEGTKNSCGEQQETERSNVNKNDNPGKLNRHDLLDEALRLCNVRFMKQISKLSLNDIVRVLRSLCAEGMGIETPAMAEVIVCHIKRCYGMREIDKKSTLPRHLPTNQLSCTESWKPNIVENSSEPCSLIAAARTPFLVSSKRVEEEISAELLSLMPRIEFRLQQLSAIRTEKPLAEASLLCGIARSILPKALRGEMSWETVLKLRRAFADFPALAEGVPKLWNLVRREAPGRIRRKTRKLYRTQMGTGKSSCLAQKLLPRSEYGKRKAAAGKISARISG